MRSNAWAEWGLVVAAVFLLAALHRVELIPVIAPIALLIGYVVSLFGQDQHSGSVKYGVRK
jgi:hypothetical protein